MGIDEVINTLRAMHDALEFYANRSKYQAATGHIVVLDDAGEQARTALSKLDELSVGVQQNRQTSAQHSESSGGRGRRALGSQKIASSLSENGLCVAAICGAVTIWDSADAELGLPQRPRE